MVKRTSHFTEVKTGSVSGATFFKKKKIRNQLLDMQSPKPHSLNEISAVCTAVNLRASDISGCRLEVEGPKLAGSPSPSRDC